jgi:hypothetical protein
MTGPSTTPNTASDSTSAGRPSASGDAARPIVVYQVQAARPTALWIIAAGLAAIALLLLVRSGPQGLPEALAQNTLVGSRGLHAFTGQLDRDTYGLFMMDVDSGNVWVYEYVPRKRTLKLVAARSFIYDRYLDNYNCDEPSPQQVEELLQRARNARNRAAMLGVAPAGGAAAANEPAAVGRDDPAAQPPRKPAEGAAGETRPTPGGESDGTPDGTW